MADFFTLAQIRAKLKQDLDLEQEQFITPSELTGYINEAIDDAEALIHGLYADYFLTDEPLSLVSGTSEYPLPTKIYAAKIRRLLYNDLPAGGSRRYRIRRVKDLDITSSVDPEEHFRYVLKNDASGQYRFKLYPTPSETINNVITIWYIRNANRLSAETDVCDIVEFINFIYAHVKWNVARKEKLGQDISIAEKHLSSERQMMEDTLATLMDDEDNEIRKDITPYTDFYYSDEDYYNF